MAALRFSVPTTGIVATFTFALFLTVAGQLPLPSDEDKKEEDDILEAKKRGYLYGAIFSVIFLMAVGFTSFFCYYCYLKPRRAARARMAADFDEDTPDGPNYREFKNPATPTDEEADRILNAIYNRGNSQQGHGPPSNNGNGNVICTSVNSSCEASAYDDRFQETI